MIHNQLLIIFLLMISPKIFASSNYGFVDVNTTSEYTISAEQTVLDMPNYRSEDSLGICFADTVATAVDKANCHTLKISCSQMEDRDKASTLDLASFGNNEDSSKSEVLVGSAKNISEGGSVNAAMINAMFKAGHVTNENCASFDKLVSKPGSPADVQRLQQYAWTRLKENYKQYLTLNKNCTSCLDNFAATAAEQLNQDFGIKKDPIDILKAFAQKSYLKLIDQLFIDPECRKVSQQVRLANPNQTLQVFPKTGKTNYAQSLQQIKTVLSTDVPVIIPAYCTDDKIPSNINSCVAGHSFLISGYRKVCKANNTCRDLVKVHNSWGQSWQEQHNGGWVDAKAVLERTNYEQGSLSWLEEIK